MRCPHCASSLINENACLRCGGDVLQVPVVAAVDGLEPTSRSTSSGVIEAPGLEVEIERCPHCQHPLGESAFCDTCGLRAFRRPKVQENATPHSSNVCGDCGVNNPVTRNLCMACGARLPLQALPPP